MKYGTLFLASGQFIPSFFSCTFLPLARSVCNVHLASMMNLIIEENALRSDAVCED